MLFELAQLVLPFAFLFFLIGSCVVIIFLIKSQSNGSPYVPTRAKLVHDILKAAGLKKGMKMLEVGCGDGRLLIEAVKTYGVSGYGVDVNDLVLQKAKWNARGLSRAQLIFENKNIRDIDIGAYDVVYVFLLPQHTKRYIETWETQASPHTLFIMHAFTVKRWEKSLVKTLPGKPYDTYYYRLKKRKNS